MIPCINQATVLPADTIRFLEIARSNGFSHVELDISKVEECIAKSGRAALKKYLVESGIVVVSLNAIENYPIMTNDEMTKSLRRCKEIIELSSSLNCKIVVVNPNEVTPSERSTMLLRFDAFMTDVAGIAEAHDVRLGFEYVSYDNRVINSLASSLGGLRRWSRGIGLVLDVFHMYRSGELIKEIPRDQSSLIWAFHVNDAPSIPISELRDSDRVMPLDGIVKLREYISQLQALHFNGPISVELFNKQYWEMDPKLVVERARSGLKELGV